MAEDLGSVLFPEECIARNQAGTSYISIRINHDREVDGMEIEQKGILMKAIITKEGMLFLINTLSLMLPICCSISR